MLVILAVFFYLHACFAFSPLDSADNRLLSVRCEVQIPTVMGIINGSDAAYKFFNDAIVDGRTGKIKDGVERSFDSFHVEHIRCLCKGGIQTDEFFVQGCKLCFGFFVQILKLLFGDFSINAHGNQVFHARRSAADFSLDGGNRR